MAQYMPPLWDRYLRTDGRVHLTGLEALVRISLDQVRRDRAAGLRVGALYSGYPGSPLAGLDLLLGKLRPILDPEDVRWVAGLNEELAASAIAGTQLLDLFPHEHYDGVIGLWFGKAPGLDRSLDAIRHANFTGISRLGGAVALVGDDPFCKSSSLPSHSEHALAHAFVPVLYPADAAEVLALGRHAFALSRYAGTWVAIKVVSDVAEGGMIVEVPRNDSTIELPKLEFRGRGFEKSLQTRLLAPASSEIEEELVYARLEAVRRYAFVNGLNPIEVKHSRDRVGIVAAGRLYRELEAALERLGLGPEQLDEHGIRLLHVQLLYPMEPRRLCEFADHLDEIVVVDERQGFLEEQIRSALFNQVDRPLVFGQCDERGAPWLARHPEVTSETLAIDLGPHLATLLGAPELARRAGELRQHAAPELVLDLPQRKPHFCSGCPHSVSTNVTGGARVGGGIGCHTLALFMDRGVDFVGAMGSEGAHWIGLSHYTETGHLFQNLGDGTYCHSGRLAVRAAVEADVALTYRLLYNGGIAMTGGQSAVGMKPLPGLIHELLQDGVRKIIAVTRDLAVTEMAEHDLRVEVIERERYAEAMRSLACESGVTVLIYDQLCANQKQRLERSGVLSRPAQRLWINTDVCEGCGDCGRRTGCLSLWPVATSLGRKTRIHPTSCSDDRSCLVGDCPAFMSAPVPGRSEEAYSDLISMRLPDPQPAELSDARFQIYMVGIGSTGVVTVNSILVRAAEIEGLHAAHVDQTGLAQRGGRVVSHCVVSRNPIRGSGRVCWGGAETLLAFDPIGAADRESLPYLDSSRTRAVLHDTLQPTAEMVSHGDQPPVAVDSIAKDLTSRVLRLERVPGDALAEVVLGSTVAANIVVLGAAAQLGLLPLPITAIECAIRDRELAVEQNLMALRLGRAFIIAPERVEGWLRAALPPAIGEGGSIEATAALLGPVWQECLRDLVSFEASPQREALVTKVAGWAADLVDYQNKGYARRYLAVLARVARAESQVSVAAPKLVDVVARELYRAMAYKDEYEVARLLLRGPFRRWLETRLGGRFRAQYHLQPPVLRALGLERKISLGLGAEVAFRVLYWLRFLRGTQFDPFGFLPTRRGERRFLSWYEVVIDHLVSALTAENLSSMIDIAAAPAEVRGYEGVKLARDAQVRAVVKKRLAALSQTKAIGQK